MNKEYIKDILLSNETNLTAHINSENKSYNQNIKLDIINVYSNAILEQSETNEKNIMILYNGNPYITLYLSIKAILLQKNIIFLIKDDYFRRTNEYIVNMFDSIIKNNNFKNFIKIYFNCNINNVVSSQKLCDKIIYIDDKADLSNLIKAVNIPVEYNGYNTVYVYYDHEDSEMNYKILQEITNYCYDNNISAETFENKNILDDIYIMNQAASNYMCIILTDNKNKQDEFKSRLRSKNIIINENPFKDNKYIFECNI